jgi:hypothetical protein
VAAATNGEGMRDAAHPGWAEALVVWIDGRGDGLAQEFESTDRDGREWEVRSVWCKQNK